MVGSSGLNEGGSGEELRGDEDRAEEDDEDPLRHPCSACLLRAELADDEDLQSHPCSSACLLRAGLAVLPPYLRVCHVGMKMVGKPPNCYCFCFARNGNYGRENKFDIMGYRERSKNINYDQKHDTCNHFIQLARRNSYNYECITQNQSHIIKVTERQFRRCFEAEEAYADLQWP
jgi:hypothetical protein